MTNSMRRGSSSCNGCVKSAEYNMAHYSPEEDLMIMMDASDKFWAGILLQSEVEDRPKELARKRPKPLAFISGKFKDTEQRWTVTQKELYPLIYLVKRLDFIILSHPQPLLVYTGHANLKQLLRRQAATQKIHLSRLQRWSLLVQEVNMAAFHLTSVESFLPDMLTRWGYPMEAADDGDSVEARSENRNESNQMQKRTRFVTQRSIHFDQPRKSGQQVSLR